MDTLFCTGQELARGTYAIVQLDPVAACADANDPEITLLAKQLPSKKYVFQPMHQLAFKFPLNAGRYLAIINRCGFMQKPQWGVYVVSQGLPTPDKDYGLHEGMCTPIFPTTEHPQAREPLRPNKEFPWKNCYHHSFPGYQILAVSSISREGASGIKLPEEEMRRLNDCFLTDSYEARETRERNEELLMNNRAQNSGDQVVNPRIHLSCEEDSEMLSPEGLPPLLPSTGPTLPGSSDPNEEDAAEPYDNFSDVTSCISGTSAEFSYTDGDEGFIRDPGSSADSVWILPTMKVWLDLSVIDSQTLPPVADFRAEVREISK